MLFPFSMNGLNKLFPFQSLNNKHDLSNIKIFVFILGFFMEIKIMKTE